MGLLATDKFKPTLFVGLGGNGGKIVDILARKLRRHPHWSRIEAMTHFLAIDTNKYDLDKLKNVPAECRFTISAFNPRAYMERKRGKLELPEDPLVTQWVPEGFVPRESDKPGAGQIRLESRLKVWYNLEDDVRAGIRRKVADVLQRSTMRENPWRDNEDRVVQVMIYGSVAGGTGSGSFLPMAYLLRDMVRDTGWGRANVVGVLSLPTTFIEKVRPELHADIHANGYAALKELEYLTRQLGYDGGQDRIEFHYDPGNRERVFVEERPFSLVYLVDRPDAVSIDRYENAVADASFLQIFSPLLGEQMGEYDNYEKHQKRLALGHFSVHYGAFGTAILQLPRRDIVRYAGLRYVARAFREYLCFGNDLADFRVPYGDPAFERLDPTEKDRRVDEKFEAYVAWRANAEEQADEKGVFIAIRDLRGKDGKSVQEALGDRLGAVYGRLDELVQISDIERPAINTGNPSIERPLAILRTEYAESRGRVRAFLDAQASELRTGRFFGDLFRDLAVNPIAQRLFFIRLLKEAFVTPTGDPGDEFLREEGSGRTDLDSPAVQDEKKRLSDELARTAQQGFVGKLFGSENTAFNAAKARAIKFHEELAQDIREDLRRFFWKGFEAELRQVAGAALSAYRKVSEVADDQARQAETDTERFRKDPGADPTSDVAQYYLDAEVLRDDRRGERLWHLLFTHHLDKSTFFDTQRIFPTVTNAFAPARDPDGRVRPRDATEIVRIVRESLEIQAGEVYARALDDLGLDLARGLDLEQRYVALLDEEADFDALRSAGRLDERVRAVPPERVRRGVEDRLKRLSEECVILAHLDKDQRADPDLRPADVYYAGLHPAFATDEAGALGQVLTSVIPKVKLVGGWDDRDTLVLYKAVLGVPVYWFKNVQSVLYPAYKRVRDDARRSYPLHIEAAWEGLSGIPDLDPVALKRADEERAKENAARVAREGRSARVRAFTQAILFGGVVEREGSWHWALSGAGRPLAGDRAGAFAAFEALDPVLRDDIEAEARRAWAEQVAERPSRARLKADVDAHLLRVKGAYALAAADQRDAECRFLREEREVIEGLAGELGG